MLQSLRAEDGLPVEELGVRQAVMLALVSTQARYPKQDALFASCP
jgi:hypothetical protein